MIIGLYRDNQAIVKLTASTSEITDATQGAESNPLALNVVGTGCSRRGDFD